VFDFNHSHRAVLSPESYATGRGSKNRENPSWAGSRHRTQLNAIYILSIRLLLRIDEALRLRWTDIGAPVTLGPNNAKLTITLNFRKKEQCGGNLIYAKYNTLKTERFADIEPFVIYMEPEEDAYLCPVRALADWIKVYKDSQVPKEGFVFRPLNARDQISHNPEEPLVWVYFHSK
jgi:hypothetical protein